SDVCSSDLAKATAPIAATAKPSAPLPTSPMKIRARGKLNGRNPMHAAISASASHAHTPLATHASATPTTSACDAAIPLMPSMKFQMLVSTSTASTATTRSEEHTSELQSRENLVCRLLL